jgi:ATP-dependent helicase IRC3
MWQTDTPFSVCLSHGKSREACQATQKRIPMTTLRKFLATLRDYQRLAFQLVLKRLQEGKTRLYVSLPTGTGKSLILAALAAHASKRGRVLVLVHLQDLVIQLAQTLTLVDLDVGILIQGHRHVEHAVLVATPQSLLAIWSAFLKASDVPVTTVFIDEAHHAVEGSLYEQILVALATAFPDESITVIGFTATPYRNDKKSMLTLLPTCAFIREVPEMIKGKWLAPLTWVPFSLNIDLSTLPTTTQTGELDYSERALTRTLVNTTLMEEMVRQIVPHLEQRPTLVFAMSVEHAEQLAALFAQQGRSAVAVSGRTSPTQRKRIYDEWRTGSIQIVCNCSLLMEGFDFPEIAALVIARPTRSPSFYMQMLGRGMRLAPSKEDCLVIDVVGNNPDLSHQIVLPRILGVTMQEEVRRPTPRQQPPPRPSEALLTQILGTNVQRGLSLLDPFGASSYRWVAYHHSYFAMMSNDIAVILEPDKSGSGLYHSRLYTMMPEQKPLHQWIEPTDLPLQQQVALVHEATSTLYRQPLGRKDAPWLNDPATDKQLTILKRMYPKLTEQIDNAQLTKKEASDAIATRRLSRTLDNPPPTDA